MQEQETGFSGSVRFCTNQKTQACAKFLWFRTNDLGCGCGGDPGRGGHVYTVCTGRAALELYNLETWAL